MSGLFCWVNPDELEDERRFETYEEVAEAISEFAASFAGQGYYKTSRGERIPLMEIASRCTVHYSGLVLWHYLPVVPVPGMLVLAACDQGVVQCYYDGAQGWRREGRLIPKLTGVFAWCVPEAPPRGGEG